MSAPGSSTTGSRREFLDQVVAQLWPHATPRTAAWLRRGPGRRYVLLPRPSRPTVAVPLRPRSAAGSVLQHYKASAHGGERLRLNALASLARIGLLDLWPGQLRIDPAVQPATGAARGGVAAGAPVGSAATAAPVGGVATATLGLSLDAVTEVAESIEDHIAAVLGFDVLISLYSGAPLRANRKPVLQVLTGSGRTIGYAKVGINALTCALVLAEAQALSGLESVGLRSLTVPRVLYSGSWADYPVLVQQALMGHGPVPDADLVPAMVEVAGIGRSSVELTNNAYIARLRARLAVLPGTRAGRLAAALDGVLARPVPAVSEADGGRAMVAESGPSMPLDLGSWHGDWTPWNMAARSGGGALVWDWERFDSGVPVGFDALHHDIQRAIAHRGRSPLDAARALVARAPTLLEPFGIDAAGARRTALLYLVDIGVRYEGDRQEEAGGRLGDLDTWLTLILQEHLGVGGPR
ncbi:MAG: hypothetical protein ACRC35_06815 [Angustibacter sp.]